MDARKIKLPLAYRRVCDELGEQPKSGRTFIPNPFEQELVEVDVDEWLTDLERRIAKGEFIPGAIELCGAPKGGDLIRPAARMSLADRVVYSAAVGACIKPIVAATRWSQGRIDCALLFNPKHPHQRRWLRTPFEGWLKWTENSLRKLDLKATKYVVTIDIAGYFENINLTLLQSELHRIGSPNEAVTLITSCLRQWAQIPDRGLPQGVLASDILAKLYLESFDKRLKDEGYTHVRYVDDMRIFCRSRAEARRALVLATELLRQRGLTVQSAKTKIREADENLRKEFAGAVPSIKAVNKEYIDEAIEAGLLPQSEESVPVSVIDDLVNAEPDAMDPEVIRRAFRRFVIDTQTPNRSMFRYLLHRLGAARDAFAVDYCGRRLRSGPEDASAILRYFEALDDSHNLQPRACKALESKETEMYPFTQFLILGWLQRNAKRLRAATLASVRRLAFRPEHPGYIQAEARALLGALGDHSDLDHIANLLKSSSDPLERAQLLCCLSRLEKGRRNSLIARLKNERPWGARAGLLAKRAD